MQILNVETGEIHKLTSHKNFEGYGQFSPDGSQLAYFYRRDGDFNNENEVFVASIAGGDGIDLTREIDRNPWRAMWMPDGQSLLVGANDGTQVSLWLQPLQGIAQSPMTYVSQIKTPTLILHDTAYPIVPITQSYELYHALKDNGVPVKFVAYPVAGHHPDDPVSHQDVYRRWLDWLDRYLK